MYAVPSVSSLGQANFLTYTVHLDSGALLSRTGKRKVVLGLNGGLPWLDAFQIRAPPVGSYTQKV
jgi:hypothetical protein